MCSSSIRKPRYREAGGQCLEFHLNIILIRVCRARMKENYAIKGNVTCNCSVL
jgi:hypothetical protein